jgi:hypothetical protein
MQNIDKAIGQLDVSRPEHIPVRNMTEEEKARIEIITKNSYRKEKFRRGLKSYSQMRVYEFYKTNPEWGAKDILINVMMGYNPDLPSDVVLEIAEYILQQWEVLQTSKKELALTT